ERQGDDQRDGDGRAQTPFSGGGRLSHARIVHKVEVLGSRYDVDAGGPVLGDSPTVPRGWPCLASRPWRIGMPKSNDSSPLNEAIAKRAYELYLQRGSVSGHELDDWLEAEAEMSRTAEALPAQVQP